MKDFEEAYKKLNKEQKEAVDSIEGPVMVVAGPGTGKTQVLTLRIANILKKTDFGANSILCLTFTRAGVNAMKNRLEQYIGSEAQNVTVNTFHSFASSLVEKYYTLLDFSNPPKLMDDTETIFLVDKIFQNYDWQYIKDRTSPSKYFGDLKSLISILKRERINPEDFLLMIDSNIKKLENDPENISSRGERKGELKKDILKKIDAFSRTKEVVKFYEIYEQEKKKNDFCDYDDVLEYAVKIVEESENARADIFENFQYILIDEHQDSSFIQNNFLKAVWGGVELPNIFVVGDDRQLIYGFSGANKNYFEEFAHFFGKAKLITLVENYRSTENILNLADELLSSSITKEKLKSNSKLKSKINLSEYNFPRDEILHIGSKILELHKKGEDLDNFAILLPKNKHVSKACHILNDMGISTVSTKKISLFDLYESESFLRILKIISNPTDNYSLCESILDYKSGIDTLTAHKFIKSFSKPEDIKIEDLILNEDKNNLFIENDPVSNWGNKLKNWIDISQGERLSRIVSIVGNEFLIEKSKDHDELMRNVEIVRSFIHLAISFEEKNKRGKLQDFLSYILRLEEYGNSVDIAQIGKMGGVHVSTFHGSKGLEYKYVFIAHMNEEIFMSGKNQKFTLPTELIEKIDKRDEETAKRELYVAITRAKEYCQISYSRQDENGRELTLLNMISLLDQNHFNTQSSEDTEKDIIKSGIHIFAQKPILNKESLTLDGVKKFVKENFSNTKISVSLLNNFFICPWKWYFKNFLRLPDLKSKSLTLGTVVHSTIEFILKNKKENKTPTDEDIKEKILEEFIKEGFTNEGDLKKFSSDAYIAIKNWLDKYYVNISKKYEIEKNISFSDKRFPNLNFYGKIDLIEYFANGDMIISDFKTGKSKTVNMIEKLDDENRFSSLMRQLAMYSYLIKGNNKDNINILESKLIFLEESPENKNYIYSTNITEEHIDLLLRDIKDYRDSMLDGYWVDRPCNNKNYDSNEKVCEYCTIANRIFI